MSCDLSNDWLVRVVNDDEGRSSARFRDDGLVIYFIFTLKFKYNNASLKGVARVCVSFLLSCYLFSIKQCIDKERLKLKIVPWNSQACLTQTNNKDVRKHVTNIKNNLSVSRCIIVSLTYHLVLVQAHINYEDS